MDLAPDSVTARMLLLFGCLELAPDLVAAFLVLPICGYVFAPFLQRPCPVVRVFSFQLFSRASSEVPMAISRHPSYEPLCSELTQIQGYTKVTDQD